MSAAWCCRGDLDIHALRRALTAAMGRHAALRNGFELALSVMITANADAGSSGWEEARRPFPPDASPVRALLMELAGQEWVLQLTVQRTHADRRSLDILFQDVFRFYGESKIDESPDRFAGAALPPAASRLRFHVPADIVARAHALARTHRATLFMTLLAAFKLVLARQVRQAEVAVGTEIPNRVAADRENAVGPFARHPLLRTDLSGDPTVRELLARVRDACLDALDAVSANDGPAPAHATFELREPPPAAVYAGGVRFQPLDWHFGLMAGDAAVSVWESAGGIEGWVDYDDARLEASAVGGLVDRWTCALDAIASAPERRISEIDIEPLPRRPDGVAPVKAATEGCVHRLFEAQAERTPDACAVQCNGISLTYAGLNARANRVAHYLAGRGAGPEVVVGLLMQRSAEMIAALLGILKTGAAYLPLDPAQPSARHTYMMQKAQAALLVTDSVASAAVDYSTSNLDRAVAPENLAYVIYTSGSTGQPKGVMVRHSGLSNFLNSMVDLLQADSRSVAIARTSLSFDIAGLEIYVPLITGGKVILVSGEPPWRELPPGVIAQGTPSNWRMFLDGGGDYTIGTLLCGGEALASDLARSLRPRCRVFYNMYGPTETTIWSSVRRIEGRMDTAMPLVPIGAPIANTQLYVLDGEHQIAPEGVAGEFYIGGAGLARGYAGEPAMTAAAFLPDPFSGAAGERLYRTGDIVRRRGGVLEFVGRADEQIKIRGYRVEPAEIESALRSHKEVEQTVVVLKERHQTGQKHLVAYVVGRVGTALSARQLRQYLQSRLPEYMVPPAYVFLDRLPLTSNGKIDRRNLPPPETWLDGGRTYVAPRTPVEEALCAAWADVLGLPRIGIDDNFFELGGDSILSLRAVARCDQAGFQTTVEQIFRTQTIAGLAPHVQASSGPAPDVNGASGAASPAPHVGQEQLDRIASMYESRLKSDSVSNHS